MRTDLKLHLAIGLGAALATVALLVLAQHRHPALSLGIAGPLLGLAIEQYQRVRNEGTPAWDDGIATAAPFVLAAILWYAVFP